MTNQIKFIEYTGSYPTWCMGRLVVEIDGERVVFEPFWESGGRCYFKNGWSEEIVEIGPWRFDKQKVPEQWRHLFEELCKVFKDNVVEGCCGGCL